MARKPLQFRLNGAEKAVFVEDGANLLEVLRRGVGDLTAKRGCAQGGCGACTVLIDGVPGLSCLTLAETVEGCSVATAGSLPGDGSHPLQEAFMAHFAAQCGFCTPGMLMAAIALLESTPHPDRDQVVHALSGNICRCTGYEPIIAAVLDVAGEGGGGRS